MGHQLGNLYVKILSVKV